MDYQFEGLKEFGWFVGTAVATALFQLLVEFSPDKITDWRTWAIGIGAAALRAGAGAALAFLAKRRLDPQ